MRQRMSMRGSTSLSNNAVRGGATRALLSAGLVAALAIAGCSGSPDDAATAISPRPEPASIAGQALTVEADQQLLSRADASRRLGPPAAVVIEEFFDYACPTCAEFERRSGADLKAFVEREQVSFVAYPYPLPRLMRGFQGAEAALCAGGVGGPEAFWTMHERILGNLDAWRTLRDSGPVLAGYAQDTGIDMEAWRDCVDRDAMAPLILADVNVARARRITGTPTFVFRKADSDMLSAVLSGADAFNGFADALEQARR